MYTEKDALRAAESLGIKFDKFTIEDLTRGMNVESEHGLNDLLTNVTDNDPIKTAKIALAHLREFPNYYNKFYGISVFEAFLKTKE